MDKKLFDEEKELRAQEGLEELDNDYYDLQEKLFSSTELASPSESMDKFVLAEAGKVKAKPSIIKFVLPIIAAAAALILSVQLIKVGDIEGPVDKTPVLVENLQSEDLDIAFSEEILTEYEMASSSPSAIYEDIKSLETDLDEVDQELQAFGF